MGCSEYGCGHCIAWIHHQFSDFGTNTKIHKYKYKYNLKIVKKIVNNWFAVQWHHHHHHHHHHHRHHHHHHHNHHHHHHDIVMQCNGIIIIIIIRSLFAKQQLGNPQMYSRPIQCSLRNFLPSLPYQRGGRRRKKPRKMGIGDRCAKKIENFGMGSPCNCVFLH